MQTHNILGAELSSIHSVFFWTGSSVYGNLASVAFIPKKIQLRPFSELDFLIKFRGK